MSSDEPEVSVWYSEPIEKVRVTATPGGISLTVKEAKEFRQTLDDVIDEAAQEASTTDD